MSDVFDKCATWKDYKILKATGLYPYFRAIEASHGGTEVEIEGRRTIEELTLLEKGARVFLKNDQRADS